MTRTPTLLLFDIDGTLIAGSGAGRAAMELAFHRAFGVPADGQFVETNGRTDRAILGDMAKRAGIQLHAAAWDRVIGEYLAVLPQTMREKGALLLPAVRELVAALAPDCRCRLALGTGNIEAGARVKLRQFDLDGYFPVGGFGDDSEHRPTMIATALREARRHYGIAFAPQQCVVVGDSARDVEAARANGMRVLGVGTGRGGPGPLAQARPDLVVPDFTDVRRVVAWLLD